jgi:pantoate--beta-alanine ligase
MQGKMTETCSTVAALRAQISLWRQAGETIALVPTMGALHEGHLALVKLARQHSQRVVVSIFVNPTQFGPHEDFNKYPRQLEQDIALLKQAGADAAYTPTPQEMYPDGFATTVSVKGLSEGLCGAFRPGHFDGVATVVSKLLLQVLPDVAIFGEKDYQQLAVIRRMVTDLEIPVQITGAPVVRAEDGLALSSRNAYLSPQERQQAPFLHQELQAMALEIKQGKPIRATLLQAEQRILSSGFRKIDYLQLVDATSLQSLDKFNRPARLLVAAYLGKTRLIDNIAVEP